MDNSREPIAPLQQPIPAEGSQGRWPRNRYVVLFEQRPFARRLFARDMYLALVGYCDIIALAHAMHLSWLGWWLDLWVPVVDALRRIIPAFDHLQIALLARGAGARVSLVQHLMAYGWVVNTPICLILEISILRLSREEWLRFAATFPASYRGLGVAGGLFLFPVALSWIIFGWLPTNALYAFDRYDWALPFIGVMFSGVTLFGLGLQISIQADAVDRKLKRQQRQPGGTP